MIVYKVGQQKMAGNANILKLCLTIKGPLLEVNPKHFWLIQREPCQVGVI